MLEQYKSHRSEREKYNDLQQRKQKPGESVDAFIMTMKKLRSRLRDHLDEDEFIKLIKKNLHHSLSSLLYAKPVFTESQLREEIEYVERNFIRPERQSQPQGRTQPPSRPYPVNEVYEDEDDREPDPKGDEVIEEINKQEKVKKIKVLTC